MWVELRYEYGDSWELLVAGIREGERVTFFGDGVEASVDEARAVAAERLRLAGYQVIGWSEVEGGWDGQLA